jgi:hypothetical protein
MHLCVDCQHLATDTQDCLATYNRSLVDGSPTYLSAVTARNMSLTGCGVDAKWFTPIQEQAEDLDDLSKIPFGR